MARSASGHHRFDAPAQIASVGLRARYVLQPRVSQAGEAVQTVGVDRRARRHVLLDEGGHGGRLEVWDDRHPDPAGSAATPLDPHHDDGGFASFELTAAPHTRLWSTHPRVIDLDLTVQRLARRVDHRAPKLVQHHPRRFIPVQSQLSLEQEGRDAPFVRGGQIGRPEPHRQWRLRVVENRASRQRDLISARGALPSPVVHHRV